MWTMTASESFLSFLHRVRTPIANYQDGKGVPKIEQYSFMDLMKALCQHAYAAALTIVTMLYSLIPLFEGFTYLLRFILDKMIDIFETTDSSEKLIKSLIFLGQLLILSTLIYFITNILLIPVLHFTLIFINKIFRASVNSK